MRVDEAVPPGASVLVVSRGDEELLDLGGDRQVAHFPQASNGVYAGHHPGSSEEAIAHLERLRQLGAQYLVVPRPSLWWLAHYEHFTEHLRQHHRVVRDDGDAFVVALEAPLGSQAQVTERIAS
jgi:hypothetical protein